MINYWYVYYHGLYIQLKNATSKYPRLFKYLPHWWLFDDIALEHILFLIKSKIFHANFSLTIKRDRQTVKKLVSFFREKLFYIHIWVPRDRGKFTKWTWQQWLIRNVMVVVSHAHHISLEELAEFNSFVFSIKTSFRPKCWFGFRFFLPSTSNLTLF